MVIAGTVELVGRDIAGTQESRGTVGTQGTLASLDTAVTVAQE